MSLFVCVIGTTFVDCKGFARKNYIPQGRNLGRVEFVHGGVGRNIAENLANLGLPVHFVSTVDRTAIGKAVVERLKSRRVDTSFLLEADQDGMGMWLAIINRDGELVGSISQMPDLTLMERLFDARGSEIIEKASHVLLELDLTGRIARNVIDLSKRAQKPVYGIPGNLDVILNNRDIIKDLECFICNDIEAGQITGMDLGGLSVEQLTGLLREHLFVREKAARYMVVTLGSRGSIYYDSDGGITGYQPAIPVTVVDSSGAGDAFFSGTVSGLVNNLPLKQAVLEGTRLASATIATAENNWQE